jgi:maltoporin
MRGRSISVAMIVGLLGARAHAQPKPDPCSGEPVTDTDKDAAPDADDVPPPTTTPPPPPTDATLAKEAREAETAAETGKGTAGFDDLEIHPPANVRDGFTFGSYGRVITGTDLRGGAPEQIKIVAHPPRIVEPTYFELQLEYGFHAQGAEMRTVTTMAFNDDLFHYTGVFDAQPAVRNLYLEAFPSTNTELWVGSRMYRGDDIYLFDTWPLDNLNTVGGGGYIQSHWDPSPGTWRLQAHVGFNRLLNDYQYQTRAVPNPAQGATVVDQLNRQRTIGSADFLFYGPSWHGEINTKLKLHAELEGLPSGTRLLPDSSPQKLPADWGTTLGAELGVWGFAPRGDTAHTRYMNLFARVSKGLAAYDPLAPPTEIDTSLRTYPNASELVFGLSAAWDTARWNVVVGAESRRFVGAGPDALQSPDGGWEYALDARPLVRLDKGFYAGADLSYQARFPLGINPNSQLVEDPGVTQIAPMLVYSPTGPTAYSRPQIRLVYRAAWLNQGALDLYVPDDPRHAHDFVQYLGLQAEWWFNSSYR